MVFDSKLYRSKISRAAPVKIICRDGQVLETPEVMEYTRADQLATRLRLSAPRSERLIEDRMASLGFLHSAPVCGYVADFFNPSARLVVEIDGPQHFEPAAHRHDRVRERRMSKKGIRTMRFRCGMVYNSPDDVIRQVRDAVELATPLA